MITAVWRASGPTFDVDAYLHRFPALEPDTVWRKGEARVSGHLRTNSGFNKTLFEAISSNEVSERVVKSLDYWRSAAEALAAQGVAAVLDLGVMVGSSDAFTANVYVDLNALQLLTTLKIGLIVSAYPSCD